MRLSNKWSYLLFLLPVLVAGLIGLSLFLGKDRLLHFYLYRLGLLSSTQSTLVIPMPDVVPRSGPTEKLMGRFLLMFSWDLDGTLDHPTLGPLPFHLSLERERGDLSITTSDGGLKASWRGKKRWIKFDKTPLTLLPSLPEGEIDGEWADEKGHKGSVIVTLKSGEPISFRGDGKKVLINSQGFRLEGELDLDLTIGKPPTLTFKHGSGKVGNEWSLKEISFDSSKGKIEGLLNQDLPLVILSGLTVSDGYGNFYFDIDDKKLIGSDFEATLTFLNENKKALFPYWEADREGGAFEVWLEKEGLIKGIYKRNEIHIFEGSFLSGIEMGPLRINQEKLEGTIKSDLSPLLQKWSQWALFPIPFIPLLEGQLDGEILLTRAGGQCHLTGENLKIGDFPISSAAFDVLVEPNGLKVKEGSLEDCMFSFDLVRKGSTWEIPAFALIWRDFLRGTATGQRTQEGAHFSFDHLSLDLTLLESFPPLQELLHRFDLKGYVKGSGVIDYVDDKWKGLFKFRGEEWMLGEKAFPFFDEMVVELDENIQFSGGSFQLEKQLLTLGKGTIDQNGVRCEGTGTFSFPWNSHTALTGPWNYQDGLFFGTVDLPTHGIVHWEKGFLTPLSLSTPQHNISCEIEDNGSVKGKWGEVATFEMTLEGEGRGEGKARLLGLPLPKVPIESPLPLEIGWIYPSVGTVPFKLTDEGLLILPGGELFSEGKGIRYEKVEGLIDWNGDLKIRLLPKAARLPLYWLERGEIAILGTVEEPKVEVKWR